MSFNTAQSWKDIYGRRNDGKVLIKGEFYAGGSYAGIGTTSIVSERNPHVHREMRSYLAGAFSERSLSEQEGLITDSIEKFMRLLDARSSATTPAGASAGFNLVELFEMLTFDITGDLAFGQNFGCLDNGKYNLSQEPTTFVVSLEGLLTSLVRPTSPMDLYSTGGPQAGSAR